MQARGPFLQDTFIDGKNEQLLHYPPKTQLIRQSFPIKKRSRKRSKALSWLADKLLTFSGSISAYRSVLYNLADLKFIEFLVSLVPHNLIFKKVCLNFCSSDYLLQIRTNGLNIAHNAAH